MHNHVVTGQPVDWGRDFVSITSLEGVDDAQDFGSVAARAGRVGKDGADGLLRVDDEHGANGECDAFLVDIGGILMVDPISPD